MSTVRSVEVLGGGLAGLSLGLALRRRGIPVTVWEAGHYPRHRVCGEFITGLDRSTAETLGVGALLGSARRHRTLAWFHRDRPVGVSRLPEAALAVSRHRLDDQLAAAFREAGGVLHTGVRKDLRDTGPGQVVAAGRSRSASPWVGLKLHASGLTLAADLELHLGDGAYVGLCGIEDGQVNVCGLFRRSEQVEAGAPATVLVRHLRAAGLEHLAERVRAANTDVASVTSVAGLHFLTPAWTPGRIDIGDAYALIPPFTGHGMAMAFQSAVTVVEPLVAWSGGDLEWDEATRRAHRGLTLRFRRRLTVARQLHRFLVERRLQPWFVGLSRAGLLPFRLLYRLLH